MMEPWNKGKKGLLKHTEEWKIEMSLMNSGKLNPFLGRHHTKEAREKMSSARINNKNHLGHPHSEKTKRTISQIKKERYASGATVSWQKGKKLGPNLANRELFKRLWANPEWVHKIVKAQHRTPNQQEQYLNAILQLNFPLQWKYVGDGNFFIGNKNPDFVNINGNKLLIEYNGFMPTNKSFIEQGIGHTLERYINQYVS